MAKNYVQEGDVITVTAGGTVSSGDGVLVGNIFGVAMTDATSGADVEISVEGVFDLPKVSADVISQGGYAYWNGTSGYVTSATSGMVKIGVVLQDVVSGGTTVRVRLNESF